MTSQADRVHARPPVWEFDILRAFERKVIVEFFSLASAFAVDVRGHLNEVLHSWAGNEGKDVGEPPMVKFL